MLSIARRFVVAGTQLALAGFLTGLMGLVLFVPLSDHGPGVSAAYGTSLMAMSVVTVLAAGATVMVVQRLAAVRSSPESSGAPMDGEPDASMRALHDLCAVVLVGTAVLFPLLVAVGVAVHFADGTGLGAVAYWSRVPGMVFVPLNAMISGLLVLEGRQRVQLRIAVENLLLVGMAVVLLIRIDTSPVGVLLAVGFLGVLVDGFTFLRLRYRLGEGSGARLGAVLRGGWAALRRDVRPYLRRLPALASGTTDALVMMSAFMAVMLFANRDGAATAAITAVLVNLVRTLVVPLKQFGIVGGRLAMAAGDPVGTGRRLRLFAGCVTVLLAPVGALLLVFPGVVGQLAGGAVVHPDAETAVRLVGLQLLVEGVAGFGSSALKIVVSPGASLPHLTGVMYGFAMPAVLLLTLTGRLSLVALWTVMLTARLAFACCVLWVHHRWRTGARETPVPAG